MKKLWSWLKAHPLSSGTLTFIVVLAGMHFFANWQAERRWERYVADARQRGVKLTPAEIEPPPVPDAENFAALPMWKGIFAGRATRPFELPRQGGNLPSWGNAVKGEGLDWIAWQTFFQKVGFIAETTDSPPRDVLRALERYAPQFQEWSEWRTRPHCRFPLDYSAGLAMALPHLGTFQDAARLFSLRMRAHLALGDSAAAYNDFLEGLQCYRMLSREPTLIAALVQVSTLALLWNSVGEGLKNHQWAEPELRRIAEDVQIVNALADFHRGVSSERVVFNPIFESISTASPWRRSQLLGQMTAGFGGPAQAWLPIAMLIPQRVFRDNQLRHNRYLDEMLARVDLGDGRYFPDRETPSGPDEITGFTGRYYYFMFRTMAPVYTSVLERFVHTQTKASQWKLATALERHWLAKGAFPATLAELAPEWIAEIPLDAGSGPPLVYRPIGATSYLLYSLGKNAVDDGGTFNQRLTEQKQKDDIWPYPPAAP